MNKRVLQKATKELDKAKAPALKKDIIVDPMGQWKYPGQVTRIPSNTITMKGVNYPVLGVPNKGKSVMMQPGAYYDFPEADYVDEYPQMKKGGALLTKKVTCKKCGWKWDAADGGNDLTTCHKCGGQGLIHAQEGAINNFAGGGTSKPPKWSLQYNPYAYNAGNVVGGYERYGDLTSQNLQLSTPDLLGRENKLNATRFPFSISAGRMYDKSLNNDYGVYGKTTNYDGYGNYTYKTPQELLDSKTTPFAGGIPLDAEISFGVEGSGINPNMKKRSKLGAQLEVGYNPVTGVYEQLNTKQRWALGNNYTNELNKKGEWRVEPYVTPLNFQFSQKPTDADQNKTYDQYLQGLVDSGSSYDPLDPNNPLQDDLKSYVEGKNFVSTGAGVDAQVKLPLGMLDAGIGASYNLQQGQGQKFSPTAHLGYKIALDELGDKINLPEINLPERSPFRSMSVANSSGTRYDNSLFEKDVESQGSIQKANASPVNKQWQPEAEDIYLPPGGPTPNAAPFTYDPSMGEFVNNTEEEANYKNGGEYIELDLTPEQIQQYAKGGYIIEDVLDYKQEGGAPGDPDPKTSFYSVKGSPGVYRKVNGKWEVDFNRSGSFQPLSKGDVKKRTAVLNSQAQPLYDQVYDDLYARQKEAFTAKPVNKPAPAKGKIETFDNNLYTADEVLDGKPVHYVDKNDSGKHYIWDGDRWYIPGKGKDGFITDKNEIQKIKNSTRVATQFDLDRFPSNQIYSSSDEQEYIGRVGSGEDPVRVSQEIKDRPVQETFKNSFNLKEEDPNKWDPMQKNTMEEQVAKSEQFIKDWQDSPMYWEMLKNSLPGNQAQYMPYYASEREKQINALNTTYMNQVPVSDEWSKATGMTAAAESMGGSNIRIYPKTSSDLPQYSLATHEDSHVSDDNGRLIPEQDLKLMRSFTGDPMERKRQFWNYDYDISEQGKKEIQSKYNYITDPTETRARLNELRFLGKESGLYDPFTQKVTPEIFKQFDNLESSPNRNQPLRELRDAYTDEQIIEMMNTISKNNESGEELKVAAKGGSICPEGYYFDEHKGECVKIEFLESRGIPDAKGNIKYRNTFIKGYNYPKDTNAAQAWEVEKNQFPYAAEDVDAWYNTWYAGRMTKPEFAQLAEQRLNAAVDSQTPYVLVADPQYKKEGHSGQLATTYIKKVNDAANKPYENKIIVNNAVAHDEGVNDYYNALFANPKNARSYLTEELMHEKTHWDDNNYPQVGTSRHDVETDQILNTILPKEYLIPGEGSMWNPDSDTLSFDFNKNFPEKQLKYLSHPTEVRARLNVWRHMNGISPMKDYHPSEIKAIINKNINDLKNDPDKASDYRNILELYHLIHGDPKVLKELNDKYVSNDSNKELNTAAEGGEYIELDLTPEEIEEYAKGGFIIEDISVPTLNQMKNGGEPKRKKSRFVEGTYDPNETAGYELTEEEVNVPVKASAWGKAAIAYEKKNSEEAFIDKKKKQFLRKNKGLNELYGVDMKNFPQDVEQNFKNEYDYKKNTAVVKKVGRQEGWNPNKRTQYVDDLNDTQRDIVAESKYGSKLQPTYWDRTLAGLATLGSKFSPELRDAMNKGYMPGLTQKESQEILNSKMTKIPFTDIDLPFAIPTGGLESFSGLEIPGVLPANYIKNRGLTTGSNYKQMPSWYTGEKMANVEDKDVMASNILSYAGLEALPELGVNLAKGSYKLAKSGTKGLKSGYVNVAEGANPFNYAWKSPAARFDNTVGYAQTIDDMPMSQQLFESIKSDPNLSFEDKILLKQYEMDSRPFTGRGGRKINQEARAQLDNLIEKSRISSDQPIVLSRRINASNKELFDAANKTYKPERPTSWSAGRDNIGNGKYGSASDRMVIKLPKGKEHAVLKNPYEGLVEYELAKFAADLKAKGVFDDVIENQLSFMKGNRASERELLLPSNTELTKIGKVKNDLGGYDFIMKPKKKSDFSILQKELPGSPNALQTPVGFQNRVFDSNVQLGSFKGKGHLSQKGYNYRTLGNEEIKAIQESKGVFPKAGKAKGGNENVKYWTKGNEKNWYAENPNQQVIRVKDNKFSTDKVADANDIEIYNHETGAFESILPKPTPVRSGYGSMDMSRYEIKNPDYFTQLLNTYDTRKLSATNKNFYKDMIASVKRQNGIATERQYNELQRLKTGNFNFGKKGYSNGGPINQFQNSRTNSKLNKFIG